MKIDFFGLFSVEILYAVLALFGLAAAAILLAVIAICKTASIKKKYNEFMKGENGKTIEKLVKENLDEIGNLKTVSGQNEKAIKDIYEKLQFTFQKIGIEKYDAFHEMGGKLSFALCMLDKQDNGYVINVMHSNTGCFAYIKEIIGGNSYIELGDEEKKALEQALAGPMGDVNLSRRVNEIISNDEAAVTEEKDV